MFSDASVNFDEVSASVLLKIVGFKCVFLTETTHLTMRDD